MHPQADAAPVHMRALLTLAWPVIVSRLTQTVITIADAGMIASLGEDSIAAVTTGGLNAFLLMILPMGMVFLVASFASQLYGRSDLAGARRYGWYGLVLALLTEFAAFATLPFLPSVLHAMEFAPAVEGAMGDYLAIRLLSAGPAVGIEALGAYYGGLSRTRIQMRVNLLAMTLNVAGNALLIHGAWGLPALGVTGAALASTLATSTAFLILLVYFVRESRRGEPATKPFSRREFTRLVRFGLPNGVNWTFEFLAFMLFQNLVVGGLGTTALAAFGIVIALNSAAFMPSFGISSAGAILVGQAIGSDRKHEVPKALRLTFTATGTWQLVVGLVYLVAPEFLIEFFVARDSESAALFTVGARMLQLSAAWQLFDAAAMSLSEVLRATGDTTFPMGARLIVAWGIFFPGSWYCVHRLGWNESGALAWLVIYLALLSCVLALRFASGAWQHIELTEAEPLPVPAPLEIAEDSLREGE